MVNVDVFDGRRTADSRRRSGAILNEAEHSVNTELHRREGEMVENLE